MFIARELKLIVGDDLRKMHAWCADKGIEFTQHRGFVELVGKSQETMINLAKKLNIDIGNWYLTEEYQEFAGHKTMDYYIVKEEEPKVYAMPLPKTTKKRRK